MGCIDCWIQFEGDGVVGVDDVVDVVDGQTAVCALLCCDAGGVVCTFDARFVYVFARDYVGLF